MLRFFEGHRTYTTCTARTQRTSAGRNQFSPHLSPSPRSSGSSRSVLLLLFGMLLGLFVGLGGWPGTVQAALTAEERASVDSYVSAFNLGTPSGEGAAEALADLLGESDDPLGLVQYLLSIGATLSGSLQGTVGEVIATYAESVGLTNPGLSASIGSLVADLPASSPILSAYSGALDVLTSKSGRRLVQIVIEKGNDQQGSPN